jgi:MFS family permease
VFLVGGLAVQIRDELDLPVSRLGVLTAVFFAASALLSSPAGRLAEGTGAALAMCAGALTAALALGGIALAPSEAVLVTALAIGGCSGAICQVASNLYLANSTDPTRQGLAFGIKQSAIPAATLLGGLAVPLVALTVGWRWAFAGGSALALLVAGSVLAARRGGARRMWSGARGPEVGLGALIVLAAGGGCGSAAANALGTFLVDSSVAAGAAEGTAGLIAAAGSAVGLATRVGVGWLADRASSGRLLWVAGLLGGGALGYALMATRSPTLLLPATALCFAGGWGWPGLFNFTIVIRNRRAPAAATGVTQAGVYLGGVLGPLLFGLVAERATYAAAWAAASAVALVAAGAIVVGRRLLLREAAELEPA